MRFGCETATSYPALLDLGMIFLKEARRAPFKKIIHKISNTQPPTLQQGGCTHDY